MDSSNATENGYSKLAQNHRPASVDGPESYELTEQDLSGEEDAIKIGTEDEVNWIRRHGQQQNGVRL